MSSEDDDGAGGGGSGGANDWCLIESDPGVFTEMLESLGCHAVELAELWSLDDDSLQQLMSSTKAVYGLIFLFQWQGHQQREHAVAKQPLEESQIPEQLFFAQQVTTNACATQAILSVLFNSVQFNDDDNDTTTTMEEDSDNKSKTKSYLTESELGTTLSEFKKFTASFPPQLAGVAISSSEDIKKVHNSFARHDSFLSEGKVHVPTDKDEAFHFVAYVPQGDTVYELDGLQKGPIIVGQIDDEASQNNRQDAWLKIARAAIQERMVAAGEEHVKFNLMAVIHDQRETLQSQLDSMIASDDDTNTDTNQQQQQRDVIMAQLASETAKREQWKVENQRRRHNYVPFCVQLLKELAAQGKLPELVQNATERQMALRAKRMEQQQK